MPAPDLDPIKKLQHAARIAAAHVTTENRARIVIILDDHGEELVRVRVPAPCADDVTQATVETKVDTPVVVPGWSVTDRAALYDGKPIQVAASRLKLLRVLVEAREKIPAKGLIGLAFDAHTSEATIRYHVGELRDELRAAFPRFDGDVIATDRDGYALAFK